MTKLSRCVELLTTVLATVNSLPTPIREIVAASQALSEYGTALTNAADSKTYSLVPPMRADGASANLLMLCNFADKGLGANPLRALADVAQDVEDAVLLQNGPSGNFTDEGFHITVQSAVFGLDEDFGVGTIELLFSIQRDP